VSEDKSSLPTQATKGVARMGHSVMLAGSGVLLHGVGDVGAVDEVVVLVEVEHGDVMRAR
jgi:hypothetical protein